MQQTGNKTHATRTVIELRKKILAGDLPGGTRLFEVPLAEERESYRIVLTDGTGVPRAQADVGEPAFLWPAASVSNALSAGMAQVLLEVRQAGGLTGHGLPAAATFALPSLIPQA